MLDTLLIMLEQTCTYIPLIAGAYISISAMKVHDLSIESAYMFGAMISAKVITMVHAPGTIIITLVVLASMLGGVCVGIIASVITTYGKLPHLLSDILTIGL